MDTIGYPSYYLYITLIIGLPFSFARPFIAFLFVVFITSAADTLAFTHTRTGLLGPYFNANDAALLIALTSVVAYKAFYQKQIQIPRVTLWIVVVLLIGFFQSWLVIGWTYEGLRALRWAISLPVFIIISATMVDDKNKVKPFLIALFLGSIVSAMEHIYYVRSSMYLLNVSMDNIGAFRTIVFRSPGLFLLLAGIIWLPKRIGISRILLYATGILFAISVLLNQTRSIWISSLLVLPIAFYYFRQKKKIIKVFAIPVMFLAVFYGTIFVAPRLVPGLDLVIIVRNRIATLTEYDKRLTTTKTRQVAFKEELETWREGTLIFGRGLFYYQPYYNPYGRYKVAWGHLGHLTTMAQLGLIGFFVYSIYFPFTVIKASKKLWQNQSEMVKFIGLLSGMTMMWFWICFLMSDSFLTQQVTSGMIFGALLRQSALISHKNLSYMPNLKIRY